MTDGYEGLSAGLTAQMALQRHGFHFSHALGQNFILDDGLLNRIIDAAGVKAGDRVLEIGAGAGVMTRLLCDRGASVTAIEVDEGLRDVLTDVLQGRSARLIFQDALRCDLHSLMGDEPYDVVANIPYYLTSDALTKLLTEAHPPRRMTLLVQLEAAQRVTAPVGTKAWCALSATARYFARAETAFEVPPQCFTPPPHVQSALLTLQRYALDERPARARDDAMLMKVIASAFAMRRKTMANNLTAAFSVSRDEALEWLTKADLDARVRGEALTVAQLCALSDVITSDRT